jgi:hypothetical protein
VSIRFQVKEHHGSFRVDWHCEDCASYGWAEGPRAQETAHRDADAHPCHPEERLPVSPAATLMSYGMPGLATWTLDPPGLDELTAVTAALNDMAERIRACAGLPSPRAIATDPGPPHAHPPGKPWLCGCPNRTWKPLDPGSYARPPAPALADPETLIMTVILAPLGLPEDALPQYDTSAGEGRCTGCRLPSEKTWSGLCWYCSTAARLARPPETGAESSPCHCDWCLTRRNRWRLAKTIVPCLVIMAACTWVLLVAAQVIR